MRLSRDPQKRRRRNTLAAAAALALLIGVVLGARAGGGDPEPGPEGRTPAPPNAPPAEMAETPVDRLTLEQQVGQLLVMRFVGAEVPSYVRDALASGHAAGVVLFGDNIVSAEQLGGLTDDLQRAGGGGALVSTDQEGGAIRNVPFAGPSVGQAGQPTADEAATQAREAAAGLRGAGINVNLAPVADVAHDSSSVMAGRAFPGGADEVADLAAASTRAYGEERVAATVKHFPGIGGAVENTDDAPVSIDRSREEIVAADLPPFRAAVAAGAPLVMASHARFPALDPDSIASQSEPIIVDLLRGELGFEGVVITDSLEAEGATGGSTVEAGAERSVAAGADIVLMTGQGSWARVHQHLVRTAEGSPDLRARVRESAARVLVLKRDLGLDPPSTP